MSKALEAAASAASETWCRFNHGEPYTGEAEAIARTAILAFLREADREQLRSNLTREMWPDNFSAAGAVEATLAALTRLAEGSTP